uniref:Uncharacterized protein n=1 Tax=Rhizobium phage IG49 TaxID=3129228 RepID=A0AAU8HZK1_9CAUD
MKTHIKFEYEGIIIDTIVANILPPIGTRVLIKGEKYIVERYNLIVKEFQDHHYEIEVGKAWTVNG